MSHGRHPLLLACAIALSGCLGSPEPYRPGFQPRPAEEKLEDAADRAVRMAVPMEIDRHDWYLRLGRKEVARVRGDIPRNPFDDYERDLVTGLKAEHAAPYLKGRTPRGMGPASATPEKKPAAAPAEGEGEGGGEGEGEGGDEGGEE